MSSQIFNRIGAVGDYPAKPLEVDAMPALEGGEAEIEGMIGSIRKLGQVSFLTIHTIRDRVQCVFEGEKLSLAKEGQKGDFVRVQGKVVRNDQAHKGFELLATDMDRLSGPFVPQTTSFDKPLSMRIDHILDQRIVTIRNLRQRAIFKLQEGVAKSFREFFGAQGFTEIHSPKIVKAGAEGGANIFKLDYFDKPAYLAQSPQFYKQFMVPPFGRVYEVGPVFRAEEHATSRHANEYTSMDMEMGYIKSFRDVMRMETGFLRHMLQTLREQYSGEVALLGADIPDIGEGIPEITFQETKRILKEELRNKSKADDDIGPDEEQAICKYVKEKTGSDFVFVTHYPDKKRPFYTMKSADRPGYTESFDLLFRGLEITSGSQRVHDYAQQVERFREKGLDPAAFSDYLELHKNGTPPHGGFGIGLERLLLKLLNGANIRETILFPRDMARLTP